MKNKNFPLLLIIIALVFILTTNLPKFSFWNDKYVFVTKGISTEDCFNFANNPEYIECIEMGNSCYCKPSSIPFSTYNFGLPDNCIKASYKYCSQWGVEKYDCNKKKVCDTCTDYERKWVSLGCCYKTDSKCASDKISNFKKFCNEYGYVYDDWDFKENYDGTKICITGYYKVKKQYQCNCHYEYETCERTVCKKWERKTVDVNMIPEDAMDVRCEEYETTTTTTTTITTTTTTTTVSSPTTTTTIESEPTTTISQEPVPPEPSIFEKIIQWIKNFIYWLLG